MFSFNELYLMDDESFLGQQFYVKEPSDVVIDHDSRRYYEFKRQKLSINKEDFHVLQITEVTNRLRVHLLKGH